MSVAASARGGIDFQAIADAIAPRRVKRDPLGLAAGFRAYRIYSELDAKSDTELAHLGLSRRDLARAAFEAIR